MKALITGIYNLFNTGTNTLKTALSSKLYHAYAPQSTTYPYGTYFIVTSNYDFYFKAPSASGSQWEDVTVQMNFFSNNSSASEITDIMGYVESLFDFCSPTVSGYTVSTFEREWKSLDWIPEEMVWMATYQYRVVLIK